MTPSPAHEAPFDPKETVAALVGLFPTLGPEEQRLSLELYRLPAEGQPVPIQRLAERPARHSVVSAWPAVRLFSRNGRDTRLSAGLR
jgi:hypothetical protein